MEKSGDEYNIRRQKNEIIMLENEIESLQSLLVSHDTQMAAYQALEVDYQKSLRPKTLFRILALIGVGVLLAGLYGLITESVTALLILMGLVFLIPHLYFNEKSKTQGRLFRQKVFDLDLPQDPVSYRSEILKELETCQKSLVELRDELDQKLRNIADLKNFI